VRTVKAAANPNLALETLSKVLSLEACGYSIAAMGFVAFLTTNGTSSGISGVVSIIAASLIAVGLLLPAGGMFLLRRGLENTHIEARRSLSLQGFGLVILFLGVVLVAVSSSLSAYLIGAILFVASGASALAGVILLRKHYASIHGLQRKEVNYLVLAMALIFSGVGLIVGSNIAFYYILSQVGNIVYADLGATISAYGCVIAAYSFFITAANHHKMNV